MRTYLVRISGGRDVEVKADGYNIMGSDTLVFVRERPLNRPTSFSDLAKEQRYLDEGQFAIELVQAFAPGFWEWVRASEDENEPK